MKLLFTQKKSYDFFFPCVIYKRRDIPVGFLAQLVSFLVKKENETYFMYELVSLKCRGTLTML